MNIIAENDDVELTYWDECEPKEYVNIKVLIDDDGSEDLYISINDDLVLSWDAMKALVSYLDLCMLEDNDKNDWIEKYSTKKKV